MNPGHRLQSLYSLPLWSKGRLSCDTTAPGATDSLFPERIDEAQTRDAQWEMRELDPVAYILWVGIVMSREGHQPAQIPGWPDHLSHNPGIFLTLAAAWDIIRHGSRRKMLSKLPLSDGMNVCLSNQTVSSVRTRTLLCSSFYYQCLVQELRCTPFITSASIY